MTLLLVSSVIASPLTLAGGGVETGVVEASPAVSVDAGSVSPSIGLGTGLGDHFDLEASTGLGASWGQGAGFEGVEGMGRWLPTSFLAVGLQASWSPEPGASRIGPCAHAFYEGERFGVTANVSVLPAIGARDVEVAVGLAPELFLGERFTTFVEVDPTWAEGAVAVTLVPGFSASFDAAGDHSITVGVELPTADPAGFVAGIGYTAVIHTRKDTPEVRVADAEPVSGPVAVASAAD